MKDEMVHALCKGRQFLVIHLYLSSFCGRRETKKEIGGCPLGALVRVKTDYVIPLQL